MKIILKNQKELDVTTVTKQYMGSRGNDDAKPEVFLEINLKKSHTETVEELVELLNGNTDIIYLSTEYETTEFNGFGKIDGIFERHDSNERQVNIRLKK